jgi:hypothetical protein
MKKNLTLLTSLIFLFSCSTSVQKGQFTVTGELKNTPDQQIYLEELYFSQKDPAVLDTAEIKNGKFSLTAQAPEEGLYRLRLEKSQAAFIFINDQPTIPFSSDLNSLSLENAKFNSPANYLLRSFMVDIEKKRKELEDKAKAEGKAEIAKNLLKLGLPLDSITKATGLSNHQIEKLKS